MLFLAILISIAPGDLTGFWHSEPDLSEGYGSCYFFWPTGEYVYLRSLEEGILYQGDWFITSDELVLNRWDAVTVSGMAVNMRYLEITLSISIPGGKGGRIVLDGESFYLLDRDPSEAIIALSPAYGMSESEADAFSTYD